MSEDEHLVCPNHPGEVVRLVEVEGDDEWVECLLCEEVYPNLLRYPVQQVHNRSAGEFYLKNMLTGEIVGSGAYAGEQDDLDESSG